MIRRRSPLVGERLQDHRWTCGGHAEGPALITGRARRERTASGRAYHVSTVRPATPSHANPLVLGPSSVMGTPSPGANHATRNPALPRPNAATTPTNSCRRTYGHAAPGGVHRAACRRPAPANP